MPRFNHSTILLVACFWLVKTSSLAAEPEGFGALSRGGTGGEVIPVTNLNDSGKGSLRAALSNRSQPRVVVFHVAGAIELEKPIRVNHGRVTIDGFSAPGDGITLKNHGLYFKGDCDDIVIRNLRIRITQGGDAGDGIVFLANEGAVIERVLVDHCSILWATDEAFDTWGKVRDLTCQWSVLAEGRVDGDHAKGSHSMGWLSGPETDRVTIHHCLFAHNADRNPKVQGGRYELVNNVIYNWRGLNAMKVNHGARVDLVGNTFLPGPDSDAAKGCVVIEDPALEGKASRLHVHGNRGPLNSDGSFWANVNWFEQSGGGSKRHRPAPLAFRADAPHAESGLRHQPAEDAYEAVLAQAEPRSRDADEKRIVQEVRRRVGSVGNGSYLKLIAGHFTKLRATGTDRFGKIVTPMWMSVLDTHNGQPVMDHVSPRVYRKIGAPGGTTLYWDQPLIVAAHVTSLLTGERTHAAAADDYLKSFLARCVDAEGMFQWGNHQYYDATTDRVIGFSGSYHELRPITPAWDLFWRHSPEATAKYVRRMAQRHVFDPETGGFNRHDDRKQGHAFIESGGILVESLAWLYRKTGAEDLLQLALKIARYSHSHRGKTTGLIINEPDKGRWDARVSTTEVGVWAQSLLRAASYSANEEFAQMAQDGVSAYLKFGYDEKAGKYFGQIGVADGKPVIASKEGYWPRKYANIWTLDQWPTHDYPLALAEACITLHEKTGEPEFKAAIHRWARVVTEATPANDGRGAYAEHYGRCIHFLTRAGRHLQDEKLIDQARSLATEAVDSLYENGMFQSFPDTHLCRSVDGLGYLFLALLNLESGRELAMNGFGF